MELVRIRCTNCGANFDEVDSEQKVYHCTRKGCGAVFLVAQGNQFAQIDEMKAQHIAHLRLAMFASLNPFNLKLANQHANNIMAIIPNDFQAKVVWCLCEMKNGDARPLRTFLDSTAECTNFEFDRLYPTLLKTLDYRELHELEKAINHWDNLENKDSYFTEIRQRTKVLREEADSYSNIPRDVFVCHSSSDATVVEKAVAALEKDGNKCWYSKRNLLPNTPNYWQDIEQAIDKCSIFLVICSEASMLSRDVQRELNIAQTLDKPRLELKLDDVRHTTLFRHFFDGISWISMNNGNTVAFSELKERVFSILKAEDQALWKPVDKKRVNDSTVKVNMPAYLLQEKQANTPNLEVAGILALSHEKISTLDNKKLQYACEALAAENDWFKQVDDVALWDKYILHKRAIDEEISRRRSAQEPSEVVPPKFEANLESTEDKKVNLKTYTIQHNIREILALPKRSIESMSERELENKRSKLVQLRDTLMYKDRHSYKDANAIYNQCLSQLEIIRNETERRLHNESHAKPPLPLPKRRTRIICALLPLVLLLMLVLATDPIGFTVPDWVKVVGDIIDYVMDHKALSILSAIVGVTYAIGLFADFKKDSIPFSCLLLSTAGILLSYIASNMSAFHYYLLAMRTGQNLQQWSLNAFALCLLSFAIALFSKIRKNVIVSVCVKK